MDRGEVRHRVNDLADIEGTYTVTATVEFKDGTKQSTSTEYDIADSYVDMR